MTLTQRAAMLIALLSMAACRAPDPATEMAPLPVLDTFASATGLDTHQIDYSRFASRATAYIAATRCGLDASRFTCVMARGPAIPEAAGCRFVWPLKPVLEDGKLSPVTNRRQALQSQFQNGGLGRSDQTMAGVAVVSCPDGRVLRVTFLLSDANQTDQYKSLLRTVGFDWAAGRVHRDGNLYELEHFALASLLHVSQDISLRRNGLKAADGRVVFDKAAVKAAGRVRRRDGLLRVGNNSGNELALSRGACRIALSAADVTPVHVAPSEFVEDYHGSMSMAVLSDGAGLRSAPCPLIVAWLAGRSGGPPGLPTRYTAPTVEILAGVDKPVEALQAAVATRTAAVNLYLLGFEVPEPDPARPLNTGARGMWPRVDLLPAPPARWQADRRR